MAKRWSEVLASPQFQQLSAPDKAAAQSQYFDTVVKPNLKPDDVDAAQKQFYSQYPVGGDNQPTQPNQTQEQPQEQQPALNANGLPQQVPEDESSLGYMVEHPEKIGEGFKNLGNAMLTGGAKWLMSEHHLTGPEPTDNPNPQPQGAAANWYAQNTATPEQKQNTEAINQTIDYGLRYGAGAAATGGLLPEATLAARPVMALAKWGLSNVAGSAAAQEGTTGDVTLKQTGLDLATSALMGGLIHTAAKASAPAPDIYQKAANAVDRSVLERMANQTPEAREAYNTATEGAVTPANIFNNEGGKKYIQAEERGLSAGDAGPYAEQYKAASSGKGITNAVNDVNESRKLINPQSLSDIGNDITKAFSERSKQDYQVKAKAIDDTLKANNVKALKFPDTQAEAQSILNKNDTGNFEFLNPEAKKTLNTMANGNTRFNSIADVDQAKRILKEQADSAYENGNYEQSKSLRNVLNKFKGEFDSTLKTIDPDLQSHYLKADKNYAESIGDFDKKSPLYKLANAKHEELGADYLVKTERGRLDANEILDMLDREAANGTMPGIEKLRENFNAALANNSRVQALKAGSNNLNFSNNTFAKNLKRTSQLAERTNEASPHEELDIHNALKDATQTLLERKTVSASKMRGILSYLTRTAARAAAYHASPVTGVLSDAAINEFRGALSRAGDKAINNEAKEIIDLLYSNEENPKKLLDILDSRGASLDTIPHKELLGIVRNIATPAASSQLTPAPDDKNKAVLSEINRKADETLNAVPEQHAQAVKVPRLADKYLTATRLYKATASAETGSMDNRFIRTKAAESGLSTAYGPVQITRRLALDMRDRLKDLTKSERDYLDRFIAQGDAMRKASDNDPVYGYGASGVLTSERDQKLYARVAIKMFDELIKKHNGDLDAVMQEWRGPVEDKPYMQKVANGMAKSRGWGKTEPAQSADWSLAD